MIVKIEAEGGDVKVVTLENGLTTVNHYLESGQLKSFKLSHLCSIVSVEVVHHSR
jgi:hypothetical protein